MSKPSNAPPSRPSESKQRRNQVIDLDPHALHHIGHNPAAMAGFWIAAIAEQGNALAGFDQCGQLVKLRLGCRRPDVLVIDAPQRFGVTAARCGAPFRRCAEFLQVNVGYPDLVERMSKLAFGKAWPA